MAPPYIDKGRRAADGGGPWNVEAYFWGPLISGRHELAGARRRDAIDRVPHRNVDPHWPKIPPGHE